MISVVICSVNKNLALQVKRNIDQTIGVEWQLILLDNEVLKKSITEVYNLGAAQAKFETICFVHEDVLFRTGEWGKRIIDYFNDDKDLSLVGVAGSMYKSRTFSGWSTGISSFDCSNVLHINKLGQEEKLYSNPLSSKKLQPTVTLDGVFICARKECWQKNPFDESIKGFHLYDIDFSFRNFMSGKVAVTFEIDLVHITEGGNFGDEWVNNTIEWHKSFACQLPKSINDTGEKSVIEKTIMKKWLHRLRGEKILFSNRLKWLKESGAGSFPFLWPHILIFLGWRLIPGKR